jgi:hypothetical protein
MSHPEFNMTPARLRNAAKAEKVLKAVLPDNTPAFVTKVFSAQTDLWLTFDLGMDAAAVAALSDALFAGTHDSGPNEMFSLGSPSGFTLTMPLAVGWQTVELHVTDTTVTGYVDGVEIGSEAVTGTGGGSVDATLGFIRVVSTHYGADFISYFRRVKMGTTRGASDLFSDDFSSGDLANWSASTGGLSVVKDPFFRNSAFGHPPPPPPIAKVLKANTNEAVQISLGPVDEVWIEFGLAISAAALTAWGTDGSGEFCTVEGATGGPCLGGAKLGAITEFTEAGPTPNWYLFGGSSNDEQVGPPAPTTDTWQTCELHVLKTGSTLVEFYVEGTLVSSFTDAEATSIEAIGFGQNSNPASGDFVYIKDIKIGSTRHGTDLFVPDLTAGDPPAGGWTCTVGFPVVVDDPFA